MLFLVTYCFACPCFPFFYFSVQTDIYVPATMVGSLPSFTNTIHRNAFPHFLSGCSVPSLQTQLQLWLLPTFPDLPLWFKYPSHGLSFTWYNVVRMTYCTLVVESLGFLQPGPLSAPRHKDWVLLGFVSLEPGLSGTLQIVNGHLLEEMCPRNWTPWG